MQLRGDGTVSKANAPIGPRAVGWLESDVSNWIAERVQLARTNANRST